MGFDDLALEQLEMVPDSPRLPYLYRIRDSHCTQKFSDNAQFVTVIDRIEARQREIRDQVPVTLARFDVQLPEMVAGD